MLSLYIRKQMDIILIIDWLDNGDLTKMLKNIKKVAK